MSRSPNTVCNARGRVGARRVRGGKHEAAVSALHTVRTPDRGSGLGRRSCGYECMELPSAQLERYTEACLADSLYSPSESNAFSAVRLDCLRLRRRNREHSSF